MNPNWSDIQHGASGLNEKLPSARPNSNGQGDGPLRAMLNAGTQDGRAFAEMYEATVGVIKAMHRMVSYDPAFIAYLNQSLMLEIEKADADPSIDGTDAKP